MRILHTLASPFWSGPTENVAQLALAQRALGCEVSVAIDRERTHTDAEELAAPRLEALGLLDDGGLELSVKSSPARLWRDGLNLRARRVDVVHTHFSHDHLLARWALKGATLVRSIHAPRSIRWSLPRADAYTVPVPEWTGRLGGARVQVWPAHVGAEFVPAPDRDSLRARLGVSGAPVVGMVSTFKASRRHELGVEAFRQLALRAPAARLVLVGDGERLEATREQVRALGLSERVTFAGYQPREAFVDWLQALDVVWILGLGNDWSARAAAQARACGVRIVAVDEGALSGYADALVAPDPSRIAQATAAGTRVERSLPTNEAIARSMLELYGASR